MVNEIGTQAGKIWNFLEANGETSLTALGSGTKLTPSQIDRALGWLAREGKINLRRDNRKQLVSLVS
ncbi:MAG: winged helix-turn-helix domain-containing protein [Deltaproteobacteria bacterium]|nr:winged helix-turn-helix domain-containing protein [Deltaproteobacteria bacterium]